MITNKFLLFVFVPLFFCTYIGHAFSQDPPTKKFVVVLDAGHGGKDPGNMGNGYREKNIALNIILKVGRELEKDKSIEVIYTRKTDVFVPLKERAETANRAEANLFVSVHCNSHSSQAKGTETYVLGLRRNADNLKVAMKENSVIYLEDNYKVRYDGFDPNSPASYIGMTLMQEEYLDQSILLADMVQKRFTNSLRRDNRGVKQDVFLVLRETYMPSVLIETGFLTNNSEGRYLNSKPGQQKMGNAIAQAVEKYKHSINMHATEVAGNKVFEESSKIVKDVVFKVQISAGATKLEPRSYNFKGLENVTREKVGPLYKYYYGQSADYLAIQDKKRQAVAKGFKSCYIVAFKNGKKISVKDALKTNVK